MSELLPCPFCGGEAIIYGGEGEVLFGRHVNEGCGAEGPPDDDPYEAKAALNRRAQPEVAQAGWQPIETAPKDGELVCVWSWRDGRFFAWWKKSTGAWMTVCDKEVMFAPTLWFDVPEPPAALDRARKGGE